MDADIKSLRARYKSLNRNVVADMIRRRDFGPLADYLQDEGGWPSDTTALRVGRIVDDLFYDLLTFQEGVRYVRVGDHVDSNIIWRFEGVVSALTKISQDYTRIHLTGGDSYDMPNDALISVEHTPTPEMIADHLIRQRM